MAQFIDRAVEIHGDKVLQSAHYKPMLKLLGKFVVGQSARMRAFSRQTLVRLARSAGDLEFDKTVRGLVSPQQYTAIKKILEQSANSELKIGTGEFVQCNGRPPGQLKIGLARGSGKSDRGPESDMSVLGDGLEFGGVAFARSTSAQSVSDGRDSKASRSAPSKRGRRPSGALIEDRDQLSPPSSPQAKSEKKGLGKRISSARREVNLIGRVCLCVTDLFAAGPPYRAVSPAQ